MYSGKGWGVCQEAWLVVLDDRKGRRVVVSMVWVGN